jgi:hypothetical protein
MPANNAVHAGHLRAQAAQCRRLADGAVRIDVMTELLALAEEYEGLAAEADARERAVSVKSAA